MSKFEKRLLLLLLFVSLFLFADRCMRIAHALEPQKTVAPIEKTATPINTFSSYTLEYVLRYKYNNDMSAANECYYSILDTYQHAKNGKIQSDDYDGGSIIDYSNYDYGYRISYYIYTGDWFVTVWLEGLIPSLTYELDNE